MTALLLKLFVKNAKDTSDPEVRGRYGILAGATGIVCNLLLFAAKLIVGTLAGSVSITADAVNNLSDASSSVITLFGFWIAKKPPDDDHPFGHARVEYLSGLAVAALILLIGASLAKTSIGKITAPEPVGFSLITVLVLAGSMAVKLWMCAFNRSLGRRIDSTSLAATAADSLNDVISTAAVLAAAVISHFTGLQLDGWIGLAVALFIIWSGIGIAKNTIRPLLGEPASPELVRMVREGILGYDDRIIGIHDLVVHDYGPGQRFASVHAEIDRNEDVLVAHDLLDNIERMFMREHRIHLTIHYDPVVTDDDETNAARATVESALARIDPRLRMHDFRMVAGPGHTNLIFDLVVPRELVPREREIRHSIDSALNVGGVKYYTVITFDSESFN